MLRLPHPPLADFMQSWSYADGTELLAVAGTSVVSSYSSLAVTPQNFAFIRQGISPWSQHPLAVCGVSEDATDYTGTLMLSLNPSTAQDCCTACAAIPG